VADSSILVDSSLWIEGLGPKAPHDLRVALKALIEANQVVVTDVVRLEVIGGAKSFEELKEFRADFEALRSLTIAAREWRRAEDLSFTLARRGVRIPSFDLLIAAVALAYNVPLWHADKDFERMKQVVPELHTFWYPKHNPEIA